MKIYASLRDRLKSQHETVEVLSSGKSNSQLVSAPSPGKWSAKDNIAHLARYQCVFLDRVAMILESELPAIERYSAEIDPSFESWRVLSINELISRMYRDRQIIFDRITNLPDTQLNRVGVHTKYGHLTLLEWTEFFLLHEAHHIYTVFQLLNDTAKGKPSESL